MAAPRLKSWDKRGHSLPEDKRTSISVMNEDFVEFSKISEKYKVKKSDLFRLMLDVYKTKLGVR